MMVVGASVSIAGGNVHAQGKAQSAGENFTLSGVIYMEGGGGLAYLQEPKLTNNAIVAVRAGGTLGPYKLTKIFQNRVELEGPKGTILVPLYGGGGETAVAAAGAGNQAAQQPVAQGGTPTPDVLAKIYEGNPNVHYYPVGTPNRNQGFD